MIIVVNVFTANYKTIETSQLIEYWKYYAVIHGVSYVLLLQS